LSFLFNACFELLSMYHHLQQHTVLDFELRTLFAHRAKHSGPYFLSLEDRFNLWYRPIFGARRPTVRLLTAISYPSGVDIVVHIFWSTFNNLLHNTVCRSHSLRNIFVRGILQLSNFRDVVAYPSHAQALRRRPVSAPDFESLRSSPRVAIKNVNHSSELQL
jgi:hypothetical protein